MRRALVAVALLCGLAIACSGEDGKLEQAQLSIAASDTSGRQGQIGCQVLPLLQGSRSYERYVVDDQITLLVTAEPGQVAVRFEENSLAIAKALTIPRSALLHGYSDGVMVRLQSGDIYTIELSSECPE